MSKFEVFKRLVCLFLCSFFITSFANPFLIDFPRTDDPSTEDYILLQEKLRELNPEELVDEIYPEDGLTTNHDGRVIKLLPKSSLLKRATTGSNLIICDPEKGLIPKVELIKINEGGENCIVTFSSYNSPYPKCLEMFIECLKETGFNGWLYYRLGGFPNPSGTELAYAGVPYCFKIFMMLEAYSQGFDNILWVDCGFLPVRDPKPLFDWIQREHQFSVPRYGVNFSNFTSQETRNLIQETLGINILKIVPVAGGYFGLKMSDPKNQKLVEAYYDLVNTGYSFATQLPYEYSYGILINRFWKRARRVPFKVLAPLDGKTIANPSAMKDKSPLKNAKKQGFFFYGYTLIQKSIEAKQSRASQN